MSKRYQTYLASREWALKREAVRARSGNTCERCTKNPQHAVHHLSYEHLYNEPLEDLMAICDPCHEFLSGKSDVDPSGSWKDPEFPHWKRDAALILSVHREVFCDVCGADPDGDYVRCGVCQRAACGECWATVGDEPRCLDHAETV